MANDWWSSAATRGIKRKQRKRKFKKYKKQQQQPQAKLLEENKLKTGQLTTFQLQLNVGITVKATARVQNNIYINNKIFDTN